MNLSIVQARIILRGTHPIEIIREAWKMNSTSKQETIDTITVGPDRTTVHIRFGVNHQHWLPESHLTALAENIMFANV